MGPSVAVIGPGDDATDDDLRDARAVGRLLAEAGCVVVTGGLGGVMAAAAAGATEAGGVAVGLLPGTDRSTGNASLTVSVATGLGEARNALVISSADAVIAIGGSWGTLSEIALAMRTGTPVFLLRGWQVVDAAGLPLNLRQVDTPDAAVRAAIGAIR